MKEADIKIGLQVRKTNGTLMANTCLGLQVKRGVVCSKPFKAKTSYARYVQIKLENGKIENWLISRIEPV